MSQSIYSEPVIDFLTVAAEYCRSLEQLGQEPVSRREFLTHMTRILPLLYVKASTLPEVDDMELGMMDGELPDHVDEAEYDYVRQAVWHVLMDKDEFLEVFTPDMLYSDEPLQQTISEHLADIYQDIKNFVAIYADRNEDNMMAAIAEIIDLFHSDWGQKAVNVMRPMHSLLYSADDVDEL